MRQVIGIGETILDIIFHGNQPAMATPGGSVFNGIISLGRMGVDVKFISETGNDQVGNIIKQFMEENRVSSEFLNIFPDGKSPVALAFLDEKSNADYLFYKDYPNQRLEVKFPVINENDILIFGSYFALNPVVREKITELLQYAHSRKAIIYYDINFRSTHSSEAVRLTPAIIENLEYADIVKGSDEDFLNLYKSDDPDRIYKEKIKFYAPNFLYTKGNKGVSLRSRTLSKEYAARSLTPVSTIGAGDSFNAGIVYGLLKYGVLQHELADLPEEKWEKIIACGIDFASEVCIRSGNHISPEFAARYPRF